MGRDIMRGMDRGEVMRTFERSSEDVGRFGEERASSKPSQVGRREGESDDR